MSICVATDPNNPMIEGWKDMFYCLSPVSWAYVGVAISLPFSILGAGW